MGSRLKLSTCSGSPGGSPTTQVQMVTGTAIEVGQAEEEAEAEVRAEVGAEKVTMVVEKGRGLARGGS